MPHNLELAHRTNCEPGACANVHFIRLRDAPPLALYKLLGDAAMDAAAVACRRARS